MQVRTNIEYTFEADSHTYRVGDFVVVKTEFIGRHGKITKIGVNDFEISVNNNDERLIAIKYEDLISITLFAIPGLDSIDFNKNICEGLLDDDTSEVQVIYESFNPKIKPLNA